MADTLCGPSNPLQNFQKHTQQDHTLQQDRLISRPSAGSSSFRSHDPATGFLDPEFEAFQAGHHHVPLASTPVPPSAMLHQPFHHQPQPLPQQSFHQPAPSATPDWALDFQRMNLSSPAAPAVVQSLAQANAPVMAAVSPGMSLGAAYQPTYQPSLAFGQNNLYSMPMDMGFDMDMGMQMSRPMEQQQQPMEAVDTFDAAAFERAFDAATQDWMESERELDELMSGATMGDLTGHDQATFEINKMNLHESTITPEPILQEEKTEEQKEADRREEADSLARTAGELLDSVSHDTSDKFAQSSFLALMRRIRDFEVKVVDENLIETSTNEFANTTGEATKLADDSPRLPGGDEDLGRLAQPIQTKDFGSKS